MTPWNGYLLFLFIYICIMFMCICVNLMSAIVFRKKSHGVPNCSTPRKPWGFVTPE